MGAVHVCVAAGGCLWETGVEICLISNIVFVFFPSRLPVPRANPRDLQDFDDNDSGPPMDHAP